MLQSKNRSRVHAHRRLRCRDFGYDFRQRANPFVGLTKVFRTSCISPVGSGRRTQLFWHDSAARRLVKTKLVLGVPRLRWRISHLLTYVNMTHSADREQWRGARVRANCTASKIRFFGGFLRRNVRASVSETCGPRAVARARSLMFVNTYSTYSTVRTDGRRPVAR